MKWATPPVIKIYEALGSVSDDRLTITDNTAKVYSSSGNKYYDVIFDPATNSITANDNGSYWKGYLGYPMIAFLLKTGILPLDSEVAAWLKDFHWKDINQKYKNDFDKTELYIRDQMIERGADLERFDLYKTELMDLIAKLGLNKLKSSAKPPQAY